jgi:UDP-N-acetyl-D-mannosaminuronic acid dehydrogenase
LTRVAIVGPGYVGLTLAVALARKGFSVFGCDREPRVLDALAARRAHLYEPGVEEGLRDFLGNRLHVAATLPHHAVDAVIISISIPVDLETQTPRLDHLRDAVRSVAAACDPATLVVVRSTVPVGATRGVALPELQRRWARPRLAFCPERTIQGQALRELELLPQVIGGLDAESLDAAVTLFSQLSPRVVRVSSLEAAEMVELINNCHTDVIYSFGNEVALMAERFGLDPLELIHAANFDYPRPDLAKPGFVGGGCLTKDPYILLSSARTRNHAPSLIEQARRLNERLPVHVATRFLTLLAETRGSLAGARVFLLGSPIKARRPPTTCGERLYWRCYRRSRAWVSSSVATTSWSRLR